MGKRQVFIHIGPSGVQLPVEQAGKDPGTGTGTGDFVERAVLHHRDALEELGISTPVTHADEMFRASIEICRTHKAWGYKRKEVEGAWATLCKRVLTAPGRDTMLISQPLLGAATRDQADLLLDQLPGTKRHVLITARDPEAAEKLAGRWAKALGKPERIHCLTGDYSPAELWRVIGRTVGFGTASLSLAGLVRPDPTDLLVVRAELERLARRNETLERQLSQSSGEANRRRHPRRGAA